MNDLQAAALALLESEMRRKQTEAQYGTLLAENTALKETLAALKKPDKKGKSDDPAKP